MISVGLSSTSTILEAVKLYNSANITYRGAKDGYVYDTTSFNAEVLMVQNRSKGEFHGGANSNGRFTWIRYSTPSVYNLNAMDIINAAFNYYNSEIMVYGRVCNYWPD